MPVYQNKFLHFLLDKRWTVIRHLLLIIPLATTLYPDIEPVSKRIINISQEDLNVIIAGVYELSVVMFFSGLIILYLNFYIIAPKFLFKNKYIAYAALLLLMATVYFFIEKWYSEYLFKGYERYITIPKYTFKSYIDNTLNPLVFLGATTGYKIFKKWISDIERMNELQNAQLKAELNQLKNQVNPHFLFNTLNNLDTLIKTDTNKASQVVYGLSDVLRYQIYDSNKDKILLAKDIEIINQLLILEKIRRDQFNYEIVVENNIDGLLIPPLLFINFIDNALKHSLDNRNLSYLKVKCRVTEKELFFFAENSKPSFINQKEKGGFGLKNAKRRLELLYDNNFELELLDEPNKYTVHLKIPI